MSIAGPVYHFKVKASPSHILREIAPLSEAPLLVTAAIGASDAVPNTFGSPCKLKDFGLYNNHADPCYLKVFDARKAADVTLGTTKPIDIIMLQGNQENHIPAGHTVPDCNLGLVLAVTASPGWNATDAPASVTLSGNLSVQQGEGDRWGNML